MDGYFFRRFVFLLLFLACSSVYGQSNDSEKVWDLSKVSEWILEHIRFPEEACGYGKAGVEQMCLSVSWDGKVVLPAPLNTLHPAYAEEIERVVSGAPRCMGIPGGVEEAYRYIEVDFYQYIPEDRREKMMRVSLHTPPVFRLKGVRSSYFEGREAYMEWLCDRVEVPESFSDGSADTVTVQYTVTSKGKVKDFSVLRCKESWLGDKLERVARKSPKWIPVTVDGCRNIDVVIRERMILRKCGRGDLTCMTYASDVYRRDAAMPEDYAGIVYNPDGKPVYLNGKNFHKDALRSLDEMLRQRGINTEYFPKRYFNDVYNIYVR